MRVRNASLGGPSKRNKKAPHQAKPNSTRSIRTWWKRLKTNDWMAIFPSTSPESASKSFESGRRSLPLAPDEEGDREQKREYCGCGYNKRDQW